MNNIRIDEDKLTKSMACFNTDDLLYTIKRDIEYLESHNKNYTKEQEHRIDRLSFVISCLDEFKKSMVTKELTFEAEDCNDPLWGHVIEILKKHDSSFDGVMYGDGDQMTFKFKVEE